MADNTPLWKLVEREGDQTMLDAIAAEYAKGRLLLVATTDLDARQAVLWNMTKIAASGDAKSPALFHSIMVASAAIPGAFPPVMIDVEANGQRFQEMHVDGGTIAQVFVYPPSLRVKEIQEEHGRSLTPSTCGRCSRPASRWRRRATGGTRCPRATEAGAKQANEISVRGTRSGAPEA